MRAGLLFFVSTSAAVLLRCSDCSPPAARRVNGPQLLADSGPTVQTVAPSRTGSIDEGELARLPWLLAYIHEVEGVAQTYVHDFADGGDFALTKGPLSHFPAAAAPSGLGLLVIETEQQGDQHAEQLLHYGADGGVTRIHAPSSRTRSLSFAPDGTWFVMESGDEGFSEIVRVPFGKKGKKTRLTQNPEGNFEPDVSPDGRFIVFTSSRDMNPNIFVMNGDGGSVRRLVSSYGEDVSPKWSPDGRWIAFISSRRGQDEIYLVRPDGGEERPLHFEPVAVAGNKMPEPREKDLRWSPDGGRVVFAGRPREGKFRLWSVDVEKGTREPLTLGDVDDDMPAWSPDGRYLAFVSTRDGNAEVYLMRSDGTGLTRITRTAQPDWLPMWLPRGAVRPPQ